MDYQAITFAIRNDVAIITLNRPEMMNALNTQMRAEITHAFKTAEKEARVVVMTGAGKAFWASVITIRPYGFKFPPPDVVA